MNLKSDSGTNLSRAESGFKRKLLESRYCQSTFLELSVSIFRPKNSEKLKNSVQKILISHCMPLS